jgi:hypothetical protein
MNQSGCPTPQQLTQLLAEDLPGPEFTEIEKHIESCSVCQHSLERLAAAMGLDVSRHRPQNADSDEGWDDFAARLVKDASRVSLPDPHGTVITSAAPMTAVPGPGSAVPGYEILAELGRGGMGVVYRAWQTSLQRPVALKMILAGSNAGPRQRERFQVEALAVARLRHPHITQIYEIGNQGGCLFFSMELAEDGSLAHHLAGQPQPPPDAARLVETLARALHYAHLQGIVHRDLKPGNVLLQNAKCKLQNAKLPPDNLQFAICNLQFPRSPTSASPRSWPTLPRTAVR